MRSFTFMHYTALPSLLQHCQALPWHMLQPRLFIDVERWDETWADHLSQLHEFASHGYYGLDVQDLDTNSQRRAQAEWHAAATKAIALLDLAYNRGLPPASMEGLFEHVLHWCNEYANHLRNTQAGSTAPIDPTSPDYPAAVQLLAMPVLLERQELIPGVVDRLLGRQCDRLLDYLSAAACDKQEASELVYWPRPYAQLDPFFEHPQDGSDALLQYLQQHYGAPSHPALAAIGRLVGLDEPHAGRWAWEVAALVVLYGLDDSRLSGNAGYPADMVLLARQRLAQHYPVSLRA